MTLRAGSVFDRYTIEGSLGEGGMGQVFRAYDPRLHRYVALKIVRARTDGTPEQNEDARRHLLHEARAAAALDHPNAVSIFDVGESDGTNFVAMELVEGRLLRESVGDASVSVATRIRWLADVARALAAAHRRGLVHRDVKPSNVMVRDDGVIKVLDFGVARRVRFVARGESESPATLTGDDDALEFEEVAVGGDPVPGGTLATLTAAGRVVGTPMYMAPEQMRGEAVDARADQFAWGVLAYELLAGEKPWGQAPTLSTMAGVLSGPLPSLGSRVPGLPPPVVRVVERTLSKDKGDRFESMGEVGELLDRALGTAAAARGRRRAPWIIASSVGAVIGAVALDMWASRGPADVAAPGARPAPFTSATLVAELPLPSSPPVAEPAHLPAPAEEPAAVAPSRPSATNRRPATRAPKPSATAAPSASAAAPAAPRSAPRCDPNYVLDENGEKRFRPECF